MDQGKHIFEAAVDLGRCVQGTPVEQVAALGKLLYDSYRAHTGGKSIATGQAIPEWPQLKREIQEAWMASAQAGLAYASSRVSTALEGLFSHGM